MKATLKILLIIATAGVIYLLTLPFNVIGFLWAIVVAGFRGGYDRFFKFLTKLEKTLKEESFATMHGKSAKGTSTAVTDEDTIDLVIVKLKNPNENINKTIFSGTRKQFSEKNNHSRLSTNSQIINWATAITDQDPDLEVWINSKRIR